MGIPHVQLGDGTQVIDIRDTTATPDTVHKGAVYYGADGERQEGAFDLTPELTEQRDLIDQLLTALEGKAAGGATLPTQEKAVEITQNGTVEVVPDDGHTLSKISVTVNVPSGGDTGIPSGYKRIDYIEFAGTQLIDTRVIGNQDTEIRASFTWGSAVQRHLFGCASSDNTASITSYMNGSWRFGDKVTSKNVAKNNTNYPYAVMVNKTTISLTGSVTAISGVSDFETVGTLLLGGARDSDGSLPGAMFTGRVFYFHLSAGGEPVLRLVPVSDGASYRFWDEVGEQFFDSLTDVPLGGGNL